MRLLKKLLRRFADFWLRDLVEMQSRALLLAGKEHAARVRSLPDGVPLRETEFRVFSQWGEDGILQYLLSRMPVTHDFFVEFGVEDYREANTRFLMLNDNWAGLIMDGSAENIERIRDERFFWRHQLSAMHAFVTRENINTLIAPHVPDADIGVLSIDIDGNDFWVWEALSIVRPRIVVCEYNSLFGASNHVSVPYDPHFERGRAHHSNLYWGASLGALCWLAEQRGYTFVGSNSAGNNAFFVRNDCAGRMKSFDTTTGFVRSRFRESRDRRGKLSYLAGDSRLEAIKHLPLVDVRTGAMVTIANS